MPRQVRRSSRRAGPLAPLLGSGPLRPLSKAHASIAAADAFFTVSLAGSLFFSVSVDAARPRIALYLALTMAPFALLAPLISPVIDRVRGGHRVVIALTCAARAAVCMAMAANLLTLLFYPLAFGALVLGKTYSVAKRALVPRLVEDPVALVDANARLSRVGAVAGAAGGAAAIGLLNLAGARWVLLVGGIVYVAAATAALHVQRPLPARPVSLALEYEELHQPALLLAASAMGILRAAEGFLWFLLAFGLKQSGEPTWFFASALAATGLGSLAGTFVAPIARRRLTEEWMLTGALGGPAFLALVAAIGYGRAGILAVALGLGVAANAGRHAFDSLVQRDAADADRGRMFARFESRFQLSWVLGALLPVVAKLPTRAGLTALGAALGFGAISFLTGSKAAHERWATAQPSAVDRPLPVQLLAAAERALVEGAHRLAVVHAATAADIALDMGDRDRTDAGGSGDLAASLTALDTLLAAAVRPGSVVDRDDGESAVTAAANVLALIGHGR
jgi:hypothetical protein